MSANEFAIAADAALACLEFVLGGDFPRERLLWHQVAARAVVVYLAGLAIVRLGKSRAIARMTPLDVILGFVLGSLLSRGITGHASISGTAVSSAALVAIHWLFTLLACRSHWFGNLIKGRAGLIVKDGQPIQQSLRQHHLSLHDLQEQLRLKGIGDVTKVQAAFKERSGEVSVLERPEPCRVLDIAVAQGVQTVRIQLERP